MTAPARKLTVVPKEAPVVDALRYPPRGYNPNVPPATWPFRETAKDKGDVVISNVGYVR